MLDNSVDFGFFIMKKLLDLAHENLANILSGHRIGVNIHGQKYSILPCLLHGLGDLFLFRLDWQYSSAQTK